MFTLVETIESFRLLGKYSWITIKSVVFVIGLTLAVIHAGLGVVRQLFWGLLGMLACLVVPIALMLYIYESFPGNRPS
jgi:hypothetical protein